MWYVPDICYIYIHVCIFSISKFFQQKNGQAVVMLISVHLKTLKSGNGSFVA